MSMSQMRSTELALEFRLRQINELLYTTDDEDVLEMLNTEKKEIHRSLSDIRLQLYKNLMNT